MSFRNRCLIAGANGIIGLSVPIHMGRDQRQFMKDIRVDNTKPWQREHLRSIISAYGRSPWFEHFAGDIRNLYQKNFNFLLDWNMCCFQWTLPILRLNPKISLTQSFVSRYESGGQIDRRNWLLPKNYQDFDGPEYTQVFEERQGFLPNLSILDLIFCEGKNAADVLWNK